MGLRRLRATAEGAATSPWPAVPVAPGHVALTLKGYLIPARQIAVSPIDVAGRVVELNIIEGKKYKKDDVLWLKSEDTSARGLGRRAKPLARRRGEEVRGLQSRLPLFLEFQQGSSKSTRVEEQEPKEAGVSEDLSRTGIGAARKDWPAARACC